MRRIIVTTFLTLDGVLQAPGGPEEDPTGGFKWGGWQAPFSDEESNNGIRKIMAKPFDLLLGRKTYEIFAAHWPYQHDEISEKFNRINKYVVGTTSFDTSWNNTIVIKENVVEELKRLKASDGPDLLVHGSSGLAQTLLENKLIDVLHLWIYPLTLGKGKQLFQHGTIAHEWKLTDSRTTTTGAILATYEPAGEIRSGSFVKENPSDKELERRKRWKEQG